MRKLIYLIIALIVFLTGIYAGVKNTENLYKAKKFTEVRIANPVLGYQKIYYDDVKTFLSIDKTDTMKYEKGVLDCKNFSIMLKENANKQGILCAVVILDYGEYSHAMNAFDTLDKGVIFVEPQSDVIIDNIKEGDNYDELVKKFTGMNVAINVMNKVDRVLYIW